MCQLENSRNTFSISTKSRFGLFFENDEAQAGLDSKRKN